MGSPELAQLVLSICILWGREVEADFVLFVDFSRSRLSFCSKDSATCVDSERTFFLDIRNKVLRRSYIGAISGFPFL